MQLFAILWPTFALAALIFAVVHTGLAADGPHQAHPPTAETFATGDSALAYFRPVEMPANNLANLFEMPVLFFVLVPLLMITHHADHLQVLLAWAFVALRAVHSVIHIGPKQVQPRFFVYLVSVAVLMAMWIGFAIDMVAAASAYHQAMAGMPQP